MSMIEYNLSLCYIFVFDDVKINIGFFYNKYFGMFIVFSDGVYVFIWIIFILCYLYVYCEIVINFQVFIGMVIDSEMVIEIYFIIGVIVVSLNCGDFVYI